MASPAHSISRQGAYPRRYRRSSFNGAKQLKAVEAPNRRVILLIGALLLALLGAAGTIAFHLVGN